MIKFDLRGEDLANFALQRTRQLIALGGRDALYSWMGTGSKEAIKSFLADKAEQFIALTISNAQDEYEELRRHFDFSSVRRLLSIGPGLCLFELLIYLDHPCDMYLVDIESSLTHTHRFKKEGSGYSNNAMSRQLLEANAVPAERISFCNPRFEILDSTSVDLVLSLYSMGFHYPLSEYAEYIATVLPKGGFMIFDSLKKKDPRWQQDVLGFETCAVIDGGKWERFVWRKYAD